MTKKLTWTALDQVLVSGGNFLTVLLGAIYLSLSDQGNFVILLSFYFFCLVFSIALVYAPSQSAYPNASQKSTYSYTLFLYHCFITVVLMLIVVLIVFIMNASSQLTITNETIVLFAVFLLLQQLADFSRRTSYVFFSPIAALFCSGTLYIPRILAFLLIQPSSLNEIILLLVYTSIPSAIVLALYIIKTRLKESIFFDLEVLTFHIKFSRNIFLSAPVGWSVAYVPVLTVGYISGPVIVGILGTLRSIVGVANVLVEMIEVAAIPYLNSIKNKKYEGYIEDFLKRIASIFSIIALMAIGIVYNFYEQGAQLINKDYINYKDVFLMLCFAYLLYFYSRIYILYYRMIYNTKPEVFYSLIVLISTILTLPLISLYGINGAGAVYILAPIAGLAITFHKFRLTFPGAK